MTTAQRTGFFIINFYYYSIRSEVSCCEKNNPPSSMAVGIDEGRNEYQGIQNVKTTGSYNVGDDEAV